LGESGVLATGKTGFSARFDLPALPLRQAAGREGVSGKEL